VEAVEAVVEAEEVVEAVEAVVEAEEVVEAVEAVVEAEEPESQDQDPTSEGGDD